MEAFVALVGRTSRVIMTPEAKILRKLRQQNGLSMQKAGDLLGYSSTYISQIENGRENVPRGERLDKFLRVYGNITEKYFKQLCKEWKDEADELSILVDLLKRLPITKVRTLLTLAQQMASGKI